MMKKTLLVALVFFMGGSAYAYFDGGLRPTVGDHSYSGLNGFIIFGSDALSIKPSFSGYHSDTSSGTHQTYGLRLGYDTRVWGVGVSGGATPKVNGYSNHFVGADAAVTLTPTGSGPIRRIGRDNSGGPAQGVGLARVDLSGGVTYTTHDDDFTALGARRGHTLSLDQTDLNAAVGLEFLDTLLSVSVTKSLYDHDLNAVSARAASGVGLAGSDARIEGFPEVSTNAKLQFSMLPLIKPYISYTRTKFQVVEPASQAYTIGGAVELMMLQVSAAYERYVQSGQSDRNYFTLGAGLRF